MKVVVASRERAAGGSRCEAAPWWWV